MTWSYQMNIQTAKEVNAALRRIKGTPARKTYFFRALLPFVIILFIDFICPAMEGDFNLGSSLSSAIFVYLIFLIVLHFSNKGIYKKQLPGYYHATVANGMLTEELTSRDGTVSNGQHPLSELLEAVPFRDGLLLRFMGPVVLFFPQAAFTQSTPQQSAAFILNAASMAGIELPHSDSELPKETGESPAYGTLYFELPESHVYTLYRQCNLYINRKPLFLYGRIFRKNKKIFIFLAVTLGVSFLLSASNNPGLILLALLNIFLFFLSIHILTLLFTFLACSRIEKKKKLVSLCGPQYIAFYESYLFLQRRQNSQKIYYREFDRLYEAKDVYFLLQKETSALIMIPKWAFTSQQEETMFVRTLKERLYT